MSQRGYLVDKCPRCGCTLRQRTHEQNAMLHALLTDISDQKEWAGQKLDVEDWKRLITAGWERANGTHVRMFHSVEGPGMDVLYRRTSRLTKQEFSELLEYATAWAVKEGVKVRDVEQAAA